jgi:DNA-binding NarL/FixJ family response regulator
MTKECKIRVLLVDNHPLVLDGLRAVLETYDDIDVAGAASNARAALELALAVNPDVVLMDINMPLLNGIDAIELFRSSFPAFVSSCCPCMTAGNISRHRSCTALPAMF